MKYLMLIVQSPEYTPTEPERWFAYTAAMAEAGVLLGGEALGERDTCKTIRPNDGAVTDGPFAETKEHMGGYYLVECDSHAEALEWAGKMPTNGPVEVWPIQVYEQPT